MQTVLEIDSRIRPYPVREAATAAEAFDAARSDGRRTLWLVDANVRREHPRYFETFADDVLEIDASEEAKSFEQARPLIEEILERGFRRDWSMAAVGGGVVQDIAAFVASILFRGARWTLVPTTLLAQCDSCIGSKSSINIGRYKNQLGTFYPPDQVLLCPALLDSLPDEAIVSGLGEVIKLHLIEGEEYFQDVRARLDSSDGLRPSREDLRAMILSSLRIKQRFIEEDELDVGIRNLLNYGHTFGHAIESATRYAVPHGVGVLLGISAATFFSARVGWVSDGYASELQSWLAKYFEDYAGAVREADQAAIVSAMGRDKKNVGAGITCILTRGAGAMEKHPMERAVVEKWLGEWIAQLPTRAEAAR